MVQSGDTWSVWVGEERHTRGEMHNNFMVQLGFIKNYMNLIFKLIHNIMNSGAIEFGAGEDYP